jgi:hypothetical protein
LKTDTLINPNDKVFENLESFTIIIDFEVDDVKRGAGESFESQTIFGHSDTQCFNVKLNAKAELIFDHNGENILGTFFSFRHGCRTVSGKKNRNRV